MTIYDYIVLITLNRRFFCIPFGACVEFLTEITNSKNFINLMSNVYQAISEVILGIPYESVYVSYLFLPTYTFHYLAKLNVLNEHCLILVMAINLFII